MLSKTAGIEIKGTLLRGQKSLLLMTFRVYSLSSSIFDSIYPLDYSFIDIQLQ